jgi:hypothetical protein
VGKWRGLQRFCLERRLLGRWTLGCFIRISHRKRGCDFRDASNGGISEPKHTDGSDDDFLSQVVNNPLGPGKSERIKLIRYIDACNNYSQNSTFFVRSLAPGGTPCANTTWYRMVDRRPTIDPVAPTMKPTPVAPAQPMATMKPATPVRPPARTRPPTTLAPVAATPGQEQRCRSVKNTITCFLTDPEANASDCNAFAWADAVCGGWAASFEYLIENTGATAVTLQAVNVSEPYHTDDSDDDFLNRMALNPLGPGQSNKIILKRFINPCSHVDQNSTFVVRSVTPGGQPCSNTVTYSIVDPRCVGITSEFCGNL